MLVLKPEDTRIKNATILLRFLLKQDSISRVELSRQFEALTTVKA